MPIVPATITKEFKVNLSEWGLPTSDEAIEKPVEDLRKTIEDAVDRIHNLLTIGAKENVRIAASEALTWAVNEEKMMCDLDVRGGKTVITMSLPIGEEDCSPEWAVSFEDMVKEAVSFYEAPELSIICEQLEKSIEKIRAELTSREKGETT